VFPPLGDENRKSTTMWLTMTNEYTLAHVYNRPLTIQKLAWLRLTELATGIFDWFGRLARVVQPIHTIERGDFVALG
jgi:hypothetical protein